MNLTIGTKIKILRSKKQITQKQLAAYLGVTEQAVSRWESGSGCPDIQLIPSIASFFSVTSDELFGITLTEREARLAEIRRRIKELSSSGNNTEETVAESRGWVAEFPGEEDIQEQLANEICRYTMWGENPDLRLLKEAERIYRTLIETTSNMEFRNNMLENLTTLYAVGFKDRLRAEETANQLPGMRYCRELTKSNVFSIMARDPEDRASLCYIQEYIVRLADMLGSTVVEYVIDSIPNSPDRWDEKIGYFERIIELYELIFGENMLIYHGSVAYICRVIATYKVAQGKLEETCDWLERMTDHVLLADKAGDRDAYTSPFTDQLSYPAASEEFDLNPIHNSAYYFRMMMNQERYAPLRENERFRQLCVRMEAEMK
ncbi:MAG: helix-turn-helix transcriptional regulator [Clostridia bacterium]|nr:helix-turn-helix transcriptional regulator [Clostridia bacterium]